MGELVNGGSALPRGADTTNTDSSTSTTKQHTTNTNNEQQVANEFGVDINSKGSWPSLLQAINYQEMKGPGYYHNDNYTYHETMQSTSTINQGTTYRGNRGRGNRGNNRARGSYHRGRGSR